MKILALDIGDQWTGSAISDPSGLIARPYQTVQTRELHAFLETLFKEQAIGTVVVGHPITMKGTVSEQTKKVLVAKQELEQKFPQRVWILWDERLSSKRAAVLKPTKDKEEKKRAHSIAAAFILDSYLIFRQPAKTEEL